MITQFPVKGLTLEQLYLGCRSNWAHFRKYATVEEAEQYKAKMEKLFPNFNWRIV